MRRSREDIIYDILEASQNETKKTRIQYQCHLNSKIINSYLDFLIEAGLLEVLERPLVFYKTTKTGNEMLESLKSLKNMLQLPNSSEEQEPSQGDYTQVQISQQKRSELTDL